MKFQTLWLGMGLVLCAQAQANYPSCSPTAANGKWILYQGAVTEGFQHTGRCEVLVNEGMAKGRCVMSNGLNVKVQGPSTVGKDCSVAMRLGFDVPNNGPHIDSDFTLQLSRDKESFVGQFVNTFGVVGLSNGVRR